MYSKAWCWYSQKTVLENNRFILLTPWNKPQVHNIWLLQACACVCVRACVCVCVHAYVCMRMYVCVYVSLSLSVGFFLTCEGSWERFDESFLACASRKQTFFTWRSARAHQLHSLDQDQSTAAQEAETTVSSVPWRVACDLVFIDRFQHYASVSVYA